MDDPLALFTTLHGFWVASIVASSGDETRELAARCLALAERAGAKGELIAGHRAVGQTLLFSGDFLASRIHFDKAIALFDPTEDQQATRYGGDHWSTARQAAARRFGCSAIRKQPSRMRPNRFSPLAISDML